LPRVLRRQPRRPRARLPDALRRVRGRLRTGPGPPVVGARRVPVPRREGLPARRGAGHDPLPLLLRGTPRKGVRPPDARPRPTKVRWVAGLNALRPIRKGRGPAGRGQPAAVLRRADRRVLPADAAVVGWVEGAERPRPTRARVIPPSAWASVAPPPRPTLRDPGTPRTFGPHKD